MITISEADFDAEAIAFLDANATKRVEEKLEWGNGNDNDKDKVALFPEETPAEEADEVNGAKTWRQRSADRPKFLKLGLAERLFGWLSHICERVSGEQTASGGGEDRRPIRAWCARCVHC